MFRFDQRTPSKPAQLSTDFTCHGRWSEDLGEIDGGGFGSRLSPTLASRVDPSAAEDPFGGAEGSSSRRRRRQRHLLVLSAAPAPSQVEDDTLFGFD